MSLRQNALHSLRTKQEIIVFLGGPYRLQCGLAFCNSHKMELCAAGEWNGANMKPPLKREYFGSSLSGALIVNLWLSFDYRFDYRLFVHQFGLKYHMESKIIFLASILGAISFSMLSYGPLLTKYIYVSDHGSCVSFSLFEASSCSAVTIWPAMAMAWKEDWKSTVETVPMRKATT